MFKKFPKIFAILKQTAIISLITFTLTEVAFRIYHHINPSFMFYDPTSYNRWRGKPFSTDYGFQLNSHGFKDVEFNLQKEEGSYRIIGIGDSFTYGGIPYKHNFLTLLEEKLNRDSSRKIELINMGIIAIGPKDYLSLLVNEGLALKPDMVLVSFYVGNDFSDNYKSREDRKTVGALDSYVISFFSFLIKINSSFEGNLYHHGIEYREDLPSMSNEQHFQLAKERSYIFVRESENSQFQEQFQDALNDLAKIQEICDRQNIKLVVAIIPDEVQVMSDLQAKIVADYADASSLDFTQPNKLLAQALAKNNINYIDLFDEFVAAGDDTRLYKLNDLHWNIAGNELAAEVIDNYLSKNFFSVDIENSRQQTRILNK